MESTTVAEAGIPAFAALYAHIRVILGIVVGLGITHLLRNLARLVEEPREDRIYWVHLVWTGFVMVYLLHFWWWEFRFSHVPLLSLPVYLFILVYALALYMLCVLLFPEKNTDPKDYISLFYVRRQWFFGLLALVFAIDFVDTLLKGEGRLLALGTQYVYRNLLFIAASLWAMVTSSRWYHGTFAVVGTVYLLFWLYAEYYLFNL